jgi:hypothetical protein
MQVSLTERAGALKCRVPMDSIIRSQKAVCGLPENECPLRPGTGGGEVSRAGRAQGGTELLSVSRRVSIAQQRLAPDF